VAHVWLGETGVSNPDLGSFSGRDTEKWCNAVAAEFLVPSKELLSLHIDKKNLDETLTRLSKLFNVSKIVILRRLLDMSIINKDAFLHKYRTLPSHHDSPKKCAQGGGNFFSTLRSRLGNRFVCTLIASTLGMETTLKDALYLLSLQKIDTFNKAAKFFGVME
jgi:Zn-dependent peptidase ImmA (M78 family)